MAIYDSKHCMLPEDPVLFTISHLVLNCGKLSYISWYITTFPAVFELVFYQMKMVHIFHCVVLVLPVLYPMHVNITCLCDHNLQLDCDTSG